MNVTPVRKRDPKLLARHFVAATIVGIPFVACLAVSFWRPDYFWPACVVGGTVCIVGLILQELRFRRYRCPDCHSLLPYPALPPGARLEYHCSKCGIIWDLGFV